MKNTFTTDKMETLLRIEKLNSDAQQF